MELFEEKVEEARNNPTIIMGDFNIRIGDKQTWCEEVFHDTNEKERRYSKDNFVSKDGVKFVEDCDGFGLSIINGSWEGDKEGNWTFIGARGNSVIDYGLINVDMFNLLEVFEVKERTESDHMPIVASLLMEEMETGSKKPDKMEGKDNSESESLVKYKWDESGVAEYKKNCRKYKKQEKDLGSKSRWDVLKAGLIYARKRKVWRARKKKRKDGGWWDNELNEMKKKTVKKKLKEIRIERRNKNDGKRIDYITTKKQYKKMCKEKKEGHKKKIAEKLLQMKSGKELWKYINAEKTRNTEPSRNIKNKEWMEHFMKLLGGTKERCVRNIENEEENQESNNFNNMEKEMITKEEVMKAVKRLKKDKAPGDDELENEIWIYANEEIVADLTALFNSLWEGEEIPEDWKKGIIIPIYKQGDKELVKNYRGITLLSTAYKIYAMVLQEKITKWCDKEGIIMNSQAGYRKQRGVIDNIYVLTKIIEKELEKKKGRLYALYTDLKAAFDSVDRGILFGRLRSLKMNTKLRQAIENIYFETSNVVRIKNEKSEIFWTSKGLRQGCPLSSILFSIYISDVDSWLEKNQAGGVVFEGFKVKILVYADDMVIIANEVKDFQSLINSLKRYYEHKQLILNVEKSKIQIFKKGARRRGDEKWTWGNQDIEIVKEYKYLGYVMNSKNSSISHIKYIVKKARAKIGAVWSIGEIKFACNFKIREYLFNTLIKPVLLFGAEIWGWEESIEVERIQSRYYKWILRATQNTPDYIWRRETGVEKIRNEALVKAWSFEIKQRKNTENDWLRTYVEKLHSRRTEGKEKEIEKERFLNMRRTGLDCNEMLKKEMEGIEQANKITRRLIEMDRQEREGRIEKSSFCRVYKDIKPETERAQYLRFWRKSRYSQTILSKFRTGGFLRGNKKWLDKEQQQCRICGKQSETIHHVINECKWFQSKTKDKENLVLEREENLRVRNCLSEDGAGTETLIKIDKLWNEQK